jgi:hypothetical protein
MKQLTTYILMVVAAVGIITNIVNLNTISTYKAEVVRLRDALQADQSLLESVKASSKDQGDLMRKAAISLKDADDLIKLQQQDKQNMSDQLTALYSIMEKHHIPLSEMQMK